MKINKEEFVHELIEEYGKLVFSICYSITKDYHDSEDLSQETFVSAYNKQDQFDGVNKKAWISKIATNKCLDYVKSKARNQIATEETYFNSIVSTESSVEDNYVDNELREMVETLCRYLQQPYKIVAFEYLCNGKTANEISSELKLPLKTVQTQIRRAKKLLQQEIRKEKKWTSLLSFPIKYISKT